MSTALNYVYFYDINNGRRMVHKDSSEQPLSDFCRQLMGAQLDWVRKFGGHRYNALRHGQIDQHLATPVDTCALAFHFNAWAAFDMRVNDYVLDDFPSLLFKPLDGNVVGHVIATHSALSHGFDLLAQDRSCWKVCQHCGKDSNYVLEFADKGLRDIHHNRQAILQAFKRCGKCKTADYCSLDCQKRDWSRHKRFCGPHYLEKLNEVSCATCRLQLSRCDGTLEWRNMKFCSVDCLNMKKIVWGEL